MGIIGCTQYSRAKVAKPPANRARAVRAKRCVPFSVWLMGAPGAGISADAPLAPCVLLTMETSVRFAFSGQKQPVTPVIPFRSRGGTAVAQIGRASCRERVCQYV